MILAEEVKICCSMTAMAIQNKKAISPYCTCCCMPLKDLF